MLELLELFITFFKIGLFTVGGGYAMIPMIKYETLSRNWVTTDELLNFLAISESTPGPFAVNMATFVGNNVYGVLGAIFATIGVVLPSFIIILAVFKIYEKFISNKYVNSLLTGIKGIVVGLIFTVGSTLIFEEVFKLIDTKYVFDYKALIIIIIIGLILYFKKKISPILIILVSAILGILLYYFI